MEATHFSGCFQLARQHYPSCAALVRQAARADLDAGVARHVQYVRKTSNTCCIGGYGVFESAWPATWYSLARHVVNGQAIGQAPLNYAKARPLRQRSKIIKPRHSLAHPKQGSERIDADESGDVAN